ncbi:hypothetical protein J8J14_21325 [Roseomonas sp. SSH11]|uniref:Uncharacterized protein n=1 Tax=Pararoseomonas baculiformis TaxID=2820812 RepID=A0ABS4AJY4_9PROT|nr:hypothetical protein [Pararoseomonas baculiformis]MBP0447316.1 hypothetical protein [Pararoseomonas baculiformis]
MDNANPGNPELPPLPKTEDLEAVRRKARKRKVPQLQVDAYGRLPGVGDFKIIDVSGTAHLEWQMQDGACKRFSFDELSRNPGLAGERLEVGWLVANLWLLQGRRVRDSIPGPNEAMRESARFFDAEDRWRHWAQVPAGHMIF